MFLLSLRVYNNEQLSFYFRISNCSNETCSGRGYCNEFNSCECEKGWTGKNCALRKCCPHEVYNLALMTYKCPKDVIGSGCPQLGKKLCYFLYKIFFLSLTALCIIVILLPKIDFRQFKPITGHSCQHSR